MATSTLWVLLSLTMWMGKRYLPKRSMPTRTLRNAARPSNSAQPRLLPSHTAAAAERCSGAYHGKGLPYPLTPDPTCQRSRLGNRSCGLASAMPYPPPKPAGERSMALARKRRR